MTDLGRDVLLDGSPHRRPLRRRLSQLEDNVGALEIKLGEEDLSRLDELTRPVFGFPQSMQPMFPSIHNGGTTVNGVHGAASGFVMEKGDKPY